MRWYHVVVHFEVKMGHLCLGPPTDTSGKSAVR